MRYDKPIEALKLALKNRLTKYQKDRVHEESSPSFTMNKIGKTKKAQNKPLSLERYIFKVYRRTHAIPEAA